MTVPLFAVIFLVLIGMVAGAVLLCLWYLAFVSTSNNAKLLVEKVRKTMVQDVPDLAFSRRVDGSIVCPCCGFSEHPEPASVP